MRQNISVLATTFRFVMLDALSSHPFPSHHAVLVSSATLSNYGYTGGFSTSTLAMIRERKKEKVEYNYYRQSNRVPIMKLATLRLVSPCLRLRSRRSVTTDDLGTGISDSSRTEDHLHNVHIGKRIAWRVLTQHEERSDLRVLLIFHKSRHGKILQQTRQQGLCSHHPL
jgi:hypothetical protein